MSPGSSLKWADSRIQNVSYLHVWSSWFKSRLIAGAALEEARKLAFEKRESLKEEGIRSLPEGFFQEDFDPVLHELQQFQPGFQVRSSNLTIFTDLCISSHSGWLWTKLHSSYLSWDYFQVKFWACRASFAGAFDFTPCPESFWKLLVALVL